MNPNRSTLWLVLSWTWIAIVSAYIVWGLVNESGLYAWLVDWQLAQWGQYYPKLTGAVPILVLGAPAFWYIRRRDQEKRASLAAEGSAAEARAQGRNARLFALAGLVLMAVGGGAYLLSQSVPDENAPPAPFDAATLGTAPAPQGRVQIRGEVDPNVGTSIQERDRTTDTTTVYVAFRPDGDNSPKDAPWRLFVQRHTGSAADAVPTQIFMPDQDGWLVENGLPSLARRDLESRGIRVADPHWVLEPRAGGTPRDTYYIVAALGLFVGFVFVLVGLIAMAKARRQLRAAGVG